jgi:predicted small secreted protein
MRTEQIIGFTKKAQNFIQTIKNSKYFSSISEITLVKELPFSNQPLTGIIIDVQPTGPEVNQREYFVQKIQMTPWSYGPMYFFHFEHFIEKKCGQIISLGECYSWVRDPLLLTEYDQAEGTFNL